MSGLVLLRPGLDDNQLPPTLGQEVGGKQNDHPGPGLQNLPTRSSTIFSIIYYCTYGGPEETLEVLQEQVHRLRNGSLDGRGQDSPLTKTPITLNLNDNNLYYVNHLKSEDFNKSSVSPIKLTIQDLSLSSH